MIDFSQEITGVDGTKLMEASDKPLTLRAASVLALIAQYEDEKHMDAREKFTRGLMATRIQRAKVPVELKVDEVATLKRLVGKAFGPAVVVAAWPLLDPAEKVE